ncbi:MAG: hypothetical protein QNJ30_05920 [Kiloniellales bacterium]|nr:hypothetical protein [Kiloniellales bacterium]
MGLGFLIHGSARGRGLLRRKPSHAELCRRLQEAIFQAVPDPLQHRLLHFQAHEGGMEVTFHPAAEAVDFGFGDDGELTVSANTSTVGPGYHAMLVELIEAIGPVAGIDWDWSDHDEDEGDETGYHESRDFGALQQEMLAWLKGLANLLLERHDGEIGQIALSMPLHYHLVTEQFAYSPLGFWDRGWFEALAAAEGERAESLAAAFFPWWNHPADAAYWRDCALVLAWTELPWTPPVDEAEQQLYELAVECFGRARKLDPSIGLPVAEIAEIRDLLSSDETGQLPKAEGIGFRRGQHRRPFGGGWSLVMPGYFRELDDEGDEGTTVLAHGERALNLSSYTFEAKTPEASPAADTVREMEAEHRGRGFCATYDGEGLTGWGSESEAEDGRCWHFQACIGKDGGGKGQLCLLTFTYETATEGRDWALEVFRSVRLQQD